MVFPFINSYSQNTYKKIEIIESNNTILQNNYQRLNIPNYIDSNKYEDLRNYILDDLTINTTDETKIFFTLMQYVSKQWPHDGWNAAPDDMTSLQIIKNAKNGERYRCVEYGKVLNDILISFGYVARTVGVKNVDAAYGGAGMGHVATEVWSNKLNKWIFLDPQFNIYAKFRGELLNIYDIYELSNMNQFKNIEFTHIDSETGNTTIDKKYGKFLENYLGYIDIQQVDEGVDYSFILKMQVRSNFLTFQAFPSGKSIFTDKKEDFYFGVNQVMVILNYTEEEYNRSQDVYDNLNIETIEDYEKDMPLFAAKPDFELGFLNNMPWFSKYEVYLNGEEIKPNDSRYFVSLKEGVSEIKVVAINIAGVKGVPTIIKIRYE
jgi:hypothetical protein